MKWRNAALALIAASALIALVIGSLNWSSGEPSLTIHLRCDGEVLGILSVNVSSLEEGINAVESFDAQTVCAKGVIDIGDYRREQILRFTFARESGGKFEVVSEYGPNVQSDQEGFYMVLKLTDSPPFIANDSI